jgi:hypothetical protein
MDLIMARLGEASQTLQYIDVEVEHRHRWVTLDRDNGGVYTGWHFIENRAMIHVKDWGGFYLSDSKGFKTRMFYS